MSSKYVAIRDCWSRVIVIGYKTDKIIQRSIIFESDFNSDFFHVL